jgi:hypothetical protein
MAIGRVRSANGGSPREGEARFKKQRRSRRAEIRPPDRDGEGVDAEARATRNAEETGRVAGVDRMHAADETRARH